MWEEPKWKQILEFPNYWVSDGGRVINLKLRKIMATTLTGGKEYVYLSKGGKQYQRNVVKLMNKYHGGENAVQLHAE